MKWIEIVNGCLLGNGCIFSDRGKYFRFKLTAKDKKFLEWVGMMLAPFGKVSYTRDERNGTHILYFRHPIIRKLRKKWYKKVNGKTIKIVPNDLELTPTTLLFWYLGDGSLIRHLNPNRVPYVVLATNNFAKEDVKLLIEKLQKLNLSFYPIKYKSGFTGKECGYAIYSKVQDGTVFRFFKTIGFECPKEIADCITGKKGKSNEFKYFKDKWPKQEEWIKILSNAKEIGFLLKERRKQLGLTQKQLANKIGISREHVRDVENGKRNASISNLRKMLRFLGLKTQTLLTNM